VNVGDINAETATCCQGLAGEFEEYSFIHAVLIIADATGSLPAEIINPN
jgi:hypothetical protein